MTIAREAPLPVRPSLNALLAQRGAPWKVRRPLASAVATAIRQHAPRTWQGYLTWVLLCITDPPRERRKKEAMMADTAGRVIDEDPEETARRGPAAPPNGQGLLAALDAEIGTRKRRKADAQAAERERWLTGDGWAGLIAQAEMGLAAVPQAREEQTLAIAEHAATLDRLEAGIEQLLVPREFRGEIQALRLRGEVYAPENEAALRALIARVRTADLADINGPIKNPNIATTWRRQFQELMPHLPRAGWSAQYREQVHRLLERIRAAREGRA